MKRISQPVRFTSRIPDMPEIVTPALKATVTDSDDLWILKRENQSPLEGPLPKGWIRTATRRRAGSWNHSSEMSIPNTITSSAGEISPKTSTPAKTAVKGIRVCRKAGCMFGRAWQRWGGRTQRHVLVESFLVVYLSVSSLSLIDAQKAVPLPTRGW